MQRKTLVKLLSILFLATTFSMSAKAHQKMPLHLEIADLKESSR